MSPAHFAGPGHGIERPVFITTGPKIGQKLFHAGPGAQGRRQGGWAFTDLDLYLGEEPEDSAS